MRAGREVRHMVGRNGVSSRGLVTGRASPGQVGVGSLSGLEVNWMECFTVWGWESRSVGAACSQRG